ncbi:MAG: dethiobiotin synthase [Synechococcus sp. SB0669_bin_7]|nr:dethiobiotin synthase [Synechococcus sp. SB0675_bin_7]MYK85902.1 dethiobiotin synthase [Synechococcus sp. SB0669_bin_7]
MVPPAPSQSPPDAAATALPRRLVVAGTDTGVGKTVVSALLVLGLAARYWKPIQAGLPPLSSEPSDSQRVQTLSGCPGSAILPEAYGLQHPASPHWAAEQEGIVLERQHLWPPEEEEHKALVVELAGGLMVPVTPHLLQIDVMGEWALPVVLVTRAGLGTINHTLLSLEALRRRRIPVLGLVLNGDGFADNATVLPRLGRTRLLGHVPRLHDVNPETLAQVWRSSGMASWWPATASPPHG